MTVIHTVLSKCGRRARRGFHASTQRGDTHFQTSHSFYSTGMPQRENIELGLPAPESRPNCDFIA